MHKNFINIGLIGLNIIFLLYYSFQILIFTDEFALKNIGFFNHAVAGLLEIIGIILFSLAIGLCFVSIWGIKNQLPLLMTIFILQFIISMNLWRYVLTNSPGESHINAITFNAIIFSLSSFNMLIILLRYKNR